MEFKKIIRKISETPYVQSAVKEKADLSAFKERPNLRIIMGLIAIGVSYIIGWPGVSFMGFLAAYFHEPMILVVGGPLIYGLSHLVFLLGMYLAGAKYTRIFMKWATRMAVEKFLEE